VYESAAVA